MDLRTMSFTTHAKLRISLSDLLHCNTLRTELTKKIKNKKTYLTAQKKFKNSVAPKCIPIYGGRNALSEEWPNFFVVAGKKEILCCSWQKWPNKKLVNRLLRKSSSRAYFWVQKPKEHWMENTKWRLALCGIEFTVLTADLKNLPDFHLI